MSDAAITPVAGGQFTPRTLVAVRVSSYTVNLYPVLNETMEVHDRAHAYHVNKAALAAQTIPTQLQLDALGNQLTWLRRGTGFCKNGPDTFKISGPTFVTSRF